MGDGRIRGVTFRKLSRHLRNTVAGVNGGNGVARTSLGRVVHRMHLTLLRTSIGFGMMGSFIGGIGRQTLNSSILRSLSPARRIVGVIGRRLARLVNKRRRPFRFSTGPPAIIVVINLRNTNGAAATKGLTGCVGGGRGGHPVLMTTSICHPTTVGRLRALNGRLSFPICTLKTRTGPISVTGRTIRRTGLSNHSLIVVSATKQLRISRMLVARLGGVGTTIGPARVLFAISTVAKRSTIGMTGSFGRRLNVANIVLAGLSKSAHKKTTLSVQSMAKGPVGFANRNRGLRSFRPFCPRHVSSEVLNVNSLVALVRHTRRSFSRAGTTRVTTGVHRGAFGFGSFVRRVSRIAGVKPLRSLLGVVPNVDGIPKLSRVGVSPGSMTRVGTVMLSVAPTRHRGPRVLSRDEHEQVTGNSTESLTRMGHLVGRFGRSESVVGGVSGNGFTNVRNLLKRNPGNGVNGLTVRRVTEQVGGGGGGGGWFRIWERGALRTGKGLMVCGGIECECVRILCG